MQLGGGGAPAGVVPSTLPQANSPGVFLITVGPGDEAWEKFGHVMLEIRDPALSTHDVAFNWGIFDFGDGISGQIHFFGNFIQGRLLYSMDGWDTAPQLDLYQRLDRDICIQELNLSANQRKELWDLCVLNTEPANRFYRYDYYVDNCSTRVRDKIDQVLGGQINRIATAMPSNLTYRSESSRLMADNPLLATAVYYILGHPIDQKLTAWDEMYIPMRMRDHFNQMKIVDETGHEVPLVKSQTFLHAQHRDPELDAPPNWLIWFLFLGVAIGGAEAGFAHLARRDSRSGVWPFAISSVFWTLLAGFFGWFLLYGWTLTDHWAVRYNENILQFSPLLLPLVVLIPKTLRGNKRAAKVARWLALSAAGLSILGLILKVLPMMYQVNWNIIALSLPANVGLAWSLWRWNVQKQGQ